MNDYKNVFIFSFSLLIYVNSNNQRVILNVLLVHTWQSARIINYRNPQLLFTRPVYFHVCENVQISLPLRRVIELQSSNGIESMDSI